MANKFRQSICYWSFYTFNLASGATSVGVVRANGCHDPDSSGVGHQPRMWDEITPLYDHYYVTGARITAKFAVPSAQDPVLCYLALKDSVTPLTSGTDYGESRNVITGFCSAEKPLVLSMRYNTKAFLGIDPDNDKNIGVARGGGSSTDPSDQASFHMACVDLSGGANNGVICTYRITYDVVFIEPRQPPQS